LVGNFVVIAFSITFTLFSIYSIRLSIVTIFKSFCFAIFINSGVLAICPSSDIISQHIPISSSPASFIKSTVASVWPFLSNTPIGFEIRGKTCPGLLKSLGFEFLSAILFTVNALSKADIPVVVSTWSTLTVKAVSWLSVLLATIASSPSLSAIFSEIGVQISPLPYVAIKFIISPVTFSPETIKSPSFSLSSSSTTIIILPFLISSIASGIVLKLYIITTS